MFGRQQGQRAICQWTIPRVDQAKRQFERRRAQPKDRGQTRVIDPCQKRKPFGGHAMRQMEFGKVGQRLCHAGAIRFGHFNRPHPFAAFT